MINVFYKISIRFCVRQWHVRDHVTMWCTTLILKLTWLSPQAQKVSKFIRLSRHVCHVLHVVQLKGKFKTQP